MSIESLLRDFLAGWGGSKIDFFENFIPAPTFLKNFQFFSEGTSIRHRLGYYIAHRSQKSQKSKFFEKSWFLPTFWFFFCFLRNGWLLTFAAHDKSCLPPKMNGGHRSIVWAYEHFKSPFWTKFFWRLGGLEAVFKILLLLI